jgi:hypothetical protein
MISLWFTLNAYAAPAAVTETLTAAVSDAYGKSVPSQAICTEVPTLPDGVDADVVVVGVTQRLAGCRLLGVWSNETLLSPGAAASAVLGEAITSSALEHWTQNVLLAFDQVDASTPLITKKTGTGWQVRVTFYQRRDARGGSLRTAGSFDFDRSGALTASDRDGGEAFMTRLVQTPYRVEGVESGVVISAVTSRGKAILDCFETAWSEDLTLDGPTRLQWTIAGSKASAVGVLMGDDDHPNLVSCYGRQIREMAFPADATGTVVWSLTADRRPE